MNYDKILEEVLFADSKEEIDKILRDAISKLRETCVEISDDEKTEFVLKLMNLRKRLGLTKEIATITGLRALVHHMPDKDYGGKSKNSKYLYGVFTSENQFFIGICLGDGNDDVLENLFSGEEHIRDIGGRLNSFEGVWSGKSENFDEKLYVVKLDKIIGTQIEIPYMKYLDDVTEYVNEYLLSDPNFVKNAFGEENRKLLIKHL